MERVTKALDLLEGHHSQPRYKMPWTTNYDYGSWDAQTWWEEPRVKKEKGKGKGRGKGKGTAVEKMAKGKKKEEQPLLLGYDGAPVAFSSSSSSSTASTKQDKMEPGLKEDNWKLKQAIRFLLDKVETKEPVPEEVQELVQEDPRELIRQKQKALNEERKLLNKSEKLQESIREKQEKFAAWDQYIRGGLQTEAQRLQNEIAEMKETMKKEEKDEKAGMDLDVDNEDPDGLRAEITQLKHGMEQMMNYTAQMESKSRCNCRWPLWSVQRQGQECRKASISHRRSKGSTHVYMAWL